MTRHNTVTKLSTVDWLGQPDVIAPNSITETMDTEVAIIGAGVGGLFTACSAAESGVKVVVIESQEHFEAHGFQYGAVNSRLFTDHGIVVDPTEVLHEWIRQNGGAINVDLVRNIVYHCGEVLDWWREIWTQEVKDACVMLYTPLPAHYDPARENFRAFPGAITFDDGMVYWRKAVGLIEQKCKELGVVFRYKVLGKQVIMTDGRATGVIGEKVGGSYLKINASKGVVVATGEMTGNAAMNTVFCPAGVVLNAKMGRPYTDARKPGDNWSMGRRTMGDGHKMVCWVGGQMVPDFGSSAGAEDSLGATATLHVNALGKRFNNEDIPVFQRGVLVAQQPDAIYWAIYDANWRATLPYQSIGHRSLDDNPYPPLATGELRGSAFLDDATAKFLSIVDKPEGINFPRFWPKKIFGASSLETLADFMGFDVEAKANFLATVTRYNELCRGGKDMDFSKDPAKMFEIKTAPFFASMGRAQYAPLSGIMTDGDSRIINAATGKPIPGLWAIGAIQGGRWTSGARTTVSALQHPAVITAGYLAGKLIAKM